MNETLEEIDELEKQWEHTKAEEDRLQKIVHKNNKHFKEVKKLVLQNKEKMERIEQAMMDLLNQSESFIDDSHQQSFIQQCDKENLRPEFPNIDESIVLKSSFSLCKEILSGKTTPLRSLNQMQPFPPNGYLP